jgi:hypothetical protein
MSVSASADVDALVYNSLLTPIMGEPGPYAISAYLNPGNETANVTISTVSTLTRNPWLAVSAGVLVGVGLGFALAHATR